MVIGVVLRQGKNHIMIPVGKRRDASNVIPHSAYQLKSDSLLFIVLTRGYTCQQILTVRYRASIYEEGMHC